MRIVLSHPNLFQLQLSLGSFDIVDLCELRGWESSPNGEFPQFHLHCDPPNLTSKLLQTGSSWVAGRDLPTIPHSVPKQKILGSWLHSHHRWNPTLPATSLFCTSFLFSLAPATKPRKKTHIMHWRNRTTPLFTKKTKISRVNRHPKERSVTFDENKQGLKACSYFVLEHLVFKLFRSFLELVYFSYKNGGKRTKL